MSGVYSTTAKADEVSDLRANQELLQRRIDQLAQAQNVGSGSYFSTTPNPAAGQPAGAGSFPRSFLIPGTETSLRIGGEIRTSAIYYFTGAPVNGAPQSTTVGITGNLESIPLDRHGQIILPGPTGSSIGGTVAGPATAGSIIDRSRANGTFLISPRESKLLVETRTPTAWGEARSYLEFDFAGSTNFDPTGAALGTSDSLVPRLRYAYGTLGGFLVGQANSNFTDPDADIEALDFGGSPGSPGPSRVPQIRYTQPLAAWNFPGAVSIALESPDTRVNTPAGTVASDQASGNLPGGPGLQGALGGVCTIGATTGTSTVAGSGCSNLVLSGNLAKAAAPVITGAYYIPQPWGHTDFSLVVKPDMQLNDGRFVNKQFTGYGAHVGFDVKPGWFGWLKDDIQGHAVIGDGIGQYLTNAAIGNIATNYLGNGALVPGTSIGNAAAILGGVASPLGTAATGTPGGGPTAGQTTLFQRAAAGNVLATTIKRVGAQIGYQHWWLPNLRQNVSIGWDHSDVKSNFIGSGQASSVNKDMTLVRTNLIWNPVAFVDVGIEYIWGHRVTVNNLRGDEHVMVSKFALKF
jgi:hypothetical protein